LAQQADTPRTLSGIRQGLVKSYTKRQALSIEYRFTSSAMGNVPAGQYVRRVIAADRRGHLLFDNAHGHVMTEFSDDPSRRITFVYPTGLEIMSPLSRVVRRYPAPSRVPLLRGLPGELVLLLGWWPFRDLSESDILGSGLSVEAVENNNSYVLRPRAEVVDGHSCDVMEIPNVDSLWVDTANGYVVRRRELFDRETGALHRRVEYRDYRFIGTDVQLPMALQASVFDSRAQTLRERERRVNRIDFHIINAESNENVDVVAMAASTRLGGTIQKPLKDEDEYELITEGEEDHAHSLVLWARKQVDSSGNRSDSDPLRLLLPPMIALGAGLAVGCLVLLVRIYFRMRCSPGTASR